MPGDSRVKSRLPSPTGRGFGSHRVGWSNRLGGTGVDGACRRRVVMVGLSDG